MSAKQAVNDKLQGGVANNKQIKKGLLLSTRVKKIKSVNIWQSYKR